MGERPLKPDPSTQLSWEGQPAPDLASTRNVLSPRKLKVEAIPVPVKLNELY